MKRPMLLPLVPLYAAGLALREMRLERGWEPVRRLKYPVISIGNLSTGGSGKTPLTITLAKLLATRGLHVDVLSRGYGRHSAVPLRVDPEGSAEQFGDEPLLIAGEARAPVYVAAERYDAGRIAEDEFTRQGGELARGQIPLVHILDDGFQHRQLGRDVDILLLSRDDWQDHLLPAGNLREGISAAKRASVIAIPASDSGFEAELRAWGWTGAVWRVSRRMEIPEIVGPIAAFCGIAKPDQFFAGLEAAGMKLAARITFADHHRFDRGDVERLVARARAAGAATLITTQKDEVRLGNLAAALPASVSLRTARLVFSIEDESQACEWLVERLSAQNVKASV